jgi:hypothetical protein
VSTSISLGDKVKDKISGFTGIAIGQTTWLNGCVRITVQGPTDKDGKLTQSECFDIQQLEVVKSEFFKPAILQDVAIAQEQRRRTGGPMPAPQRQRDPRR